MIENDYDNREKLADLMVGEMDFLTLKSFVKKVLVERYVKDDTAFESDLQWHVDEDGEWNE